MRNTITLEPDVAERVGRMVKAGHGSMEQIVDEALREGLTVMERSGRRVLCGRDS